MSNDPIYPWTRTGMVVIAHLLRGTLAYNKQHGLKPDTARSFPGTTHSTVRNYALGAIDAPQQRLGIAAIAPHLYYYSGLQGGDKILFDPNRKYKDWKELAEHVGTMASQFGPATELIDSLESAPISGDIQVQQVLVPPFIEDGEQPSTVLAQMQALLEEHLAPLRKEVQALKQQQAIGLEMAQPSSALEKFLDGWIDEASAEQLEILKLSKGNHTWTEKRSAILTALVAEGKIEPRRATEILSGAALVQPEHFILGYLFSEPKTMRAYALTHWDQLSGVVEQPLLAG